MLYITKERFEKIKKRYDTLLIVDSDIEDALNFVVDLLDAEADATEAHEPSAYNAIRTLRDAAYNLYTMIDYIENEEFYKA